MEGRNERRRQSVTRHKRELILDAARAVFEADGLEGATLRAIAARAGYTPAALYFHFDSKESIYAELLEASLARLGAAVGDAACAATGSRDRFRASALAFFDYYSRNPQDLDLGFYLFRGGMKPAGLGPDRDRLLNSALEQALGPITEAARELGGDARHAKLVTVGIFAHAAGLLLLLHTGRIRMFGADAADLMNAHVSRQIEQLAEGVDHADHQCN